MNAPAYVPQLGSVPEGGKPTRAAKVVRKDARGRLIELALHALPSIAFVAFIFDAQLEQLLPRVLLKLPPMAVMFTALWIVMLFATQTRKIRLPTFFVVLAVFAAIWLLATTVVSINLTRSVLWSLTVLFGFFGMTLAGGAADRRTKAILHRTLLTFGLSIGILAVLEGTLERSFFYGDSPGGPLSSGSQHWSTFRSYVCFNHPLVAGAVLASLSIYSLFTYVGERPVRRPTLAGLAALAAGAGSVFTVSRSAVLALGIAFVVGCLALAKNRLRTRRLWPVVFAAVVAAVYIVEFSPIAGRSQSSEGASSAIFRTEIFSLARPLSRPFAYLGSGPNTAQEWAYSSGYHRLLENSLVQLLISIGVVGLLLLLVSVVGIMAIAIRNRNIASFAALVALVCSSSAFGVLETYPVILVLFGAFGMLSMSSQDAPAISAEV